MGDVAMAIPILKTFLKQYPNVRITVLTKPIFAPLFNPLEGVEVYKAKVNDRHKGLGGLWRLSQELSLLKPTAVADLHNVLRSQILRKFLSLNGIKTACIDKGREEKRALTRSRNKSFKPLKSTVQRYSDVFASLGFPLDLSLAEPLEKEELPESVLRILGTDNLKWIGIAPFAAFVGKTYPLDMMAEVIAKLDSRQDCKVLLFGGSGDKDQLIKLSDSCKNVINMSGQFSLWEEIMLISNLDLMLSMDSGNAHLAAMYGVPTVTLWGVTHPYAGFYPFGQPMENALLADREQYPLVPTSVFGRKMPEGYEGAIATIQPFQVVEKIEQVAGLSPLSQA